MAPGRLLVAPSTQPAVSPHGADSTTNREAQTGSSGHTPQRSPSALRSASLTMRSTSSEGRVEAPVILMSCFLPVPLSVAVTDRMPLASMSKRTWGREGEG